MRQTAYILAGEPSGDKLAAALMRATKDRFHFAGVGGPHMAAEGLVSSHNYEVLQVIGIGAALRRYRKLKRLMRHMLDDVMRLRPDVVFTIDAKAFSLRFAKELKARMLKDGWQAPIIHMVAPTIWAYGAGRKQAFEAAFDGMLCLFPMERDVFDNTQVKTGFIGHPSAYLPRKQPQRDGHRLLLLPGSRRGEIQHLWPVFANTAQLMKQIDERLEVTLVTTAEMAPIIKDSDLLADVEIEIGDEALSKSFQTHDMMLAASGTVTLEAALSGIPGIVAYRLHPFVLWFLKTRYRWHITDPVLPNIILGKSLYPFYFQDKVHKALLAEGLAALYADLAQRSDKAKAQADELRLMLRAPHDSFEDAIMAALDEMNLF